MVNVNANGPSQALIQVRDLDKIYTRGEGAYLWDADGRSIAD